MNTITILSVSQLNASVRDLLEFNYGRVHLRGEISNLSAPSSGHLYFTLKDDQSQVRAAMFKGARLTSRLKEPPRNGQAVLVRAKVSLYPARGDYQLIVEHLEDAGAGDLQLAYEQLKARLSAEGLFAAEHKRALPDHPRAIAVLTSPTGAALRDILNVLQRRSPNLPVYVLPVPVQGAEAPPAIVATLNRLRAALTDGANDLPPLDALLVARGGGSMEDLWAFNDESVVRALHAFPLPVISGVGHETDVTLTDFVADVRAPTPSAGAELLSQDYVQWQNYVAQLQQRLRQAMQRQLQQQRLRLQQVVQRLQSPQRRLQDARQRLDELELRLHASTAKLLRPSQQRLQQLQHRLLQAIPSRQIAQQQRQLDDHQQRLRIAIHNHLQHAHDKLALLSSRAHSASPLAVLGRGYAFVQDADGRVLRSVNDVQVGSVMTATLHDGRIAAVVQQLHPER